MAAIEVLAVEQASEGGDALVGARIEIPAGGAATDESILHVAGWVVGRSSAVAAIEIDYRGSVVRRVELAVPRPDVTAVHAGAPERCGFEELVGVLGFTPEFELGVFAALESGERVPIAAIRARRQPLPAGTESRLAPIMVTCLGRTGTTLLMRSLAAHPEIVVYRRYPYESSPARYWLHLLRVLSEPANFLDSSHPDSFLDDIWSVGYNPFLDYGVALPEQAPLYKWAGRNYVDELADFCRRSVDGWYLAVASSQDQPAPRYFAEKHMWPGYTQDLMWELYPRGREVFLVRDFRDMVSSIFAFDERRGFTGFRRPEGKEDERYVRDELAAAAASLEDGWERRRERAHLVRYEDLVLRPSETISALLSYLELETSPETIDRLAGEGAAPADQDGVHRTARDPRASIGRWKREPRPRQELCDEVFGPLLREFGYTER
jgi:hypothetical protein